MKLPYADSSAFSEDIDIEIVGVKVSLKSFSIYVTFSYIPP